MQASAARALGQLVASLPPDRRERCCVELELVPWLCTLLTRDTYSPECQKAAVQALQLLGLCEGAPLDTIMTRGRWIAQSSARHYIQAGRAMLLGVHQPPEVRGLAARLQRAGLGVILDPRVRGRLA